VTLERFRQTACICCSIASSPSYLGDPFADVNAVNSPGEGLAVISSVFGGAVIGKSSKDFVVPAEFITAYADPDGIVWNNPSKCASNPFAFACDF